MSLKVAVIFGGASLEHEISILSAMQAIAAIDQTHYEVIPFYITKKGDWYTGKELLKLDNYRDPKRLLAQCQPVLIDPNSNHAGFYSIIKHGFLSFKRKLTIDLAFPVMHGAHGEDGSLAGLFEMMNIPYTSCDVLASTLMMDKIASKEFLKVCGVPVVDYLWFYSSDWISNQKSTLDLVLKRFDFPVIVKPANSGSSIGINVAHNEQELEDAIDLAATMSTRILIEPFITKLREINCAVLGDHENLEVSVCEEPIKTEAILSYTDKYAGGSNSKLMGNKLGGNKLNTPTKTGMSGMKRQIPAQISAELTTEIQNLAARAFKQLDGFGVVRIDFLYDETTQKVYFCEANAIPGSLSFYLWEPLHKPFTQLITQLFDLALKRHREKNGLSLSYSQNILGM